MANSAYAPRELVDRLGYIEFKLASAAETADFVRAISDPFVAATPASWNNAPSLYAASSPSISSTAWSSSPLSFQGKTGQDSSGVRTAPHAGPMTPTGLLQLPDAAMTKRTPIMDMSEEQFDLPQSEFDELMINGDGDDEMDFSPANQALTPSRLLRDLSRGKNQTW
jgi:hypothetical protein